MRHAHTFLLVLFALCCDAKHEAKVSEPRKDSTTPRQPTVKTTPSPNKEPEPAPKPKPALNPKKEPEPKQPSDKSPEPQPPQPKKPVTYAEALAALDSASKLLLKEHAAELPTKKKLLVAEELKGVERILSRKAGERGGYTAGELAFMRKHGFSNWVRGSALKWASEDKQFATVAKRVWDRSPKLQSIASVCELAVKWGELDSFNQGGMLSLMERFDRGEGVAAGERDLLRAFAGDEYFTNRP